MTDDIKFSVKQGTICLCTNEIRFVKRETKDDFGLPCFARVLQQKWRVQVNMDRPTYEWRDVEEVTE